MKRFAALVSAVLALAAIATGCGDEGGDENSLTTSSLDKAAYIERVDEICAEDRRQTPKELEAYVARSSSNSSQGGGDQYTKAIRVIFVPALEAKVKAIRALGAPDGDEEQVEDFLGEMEQAIAELNEKPIGSLGDFSVKLAPAAQIARQYGFKACG